MTDKDSDLKGLKDAAKVAGIQRIKCPDCGARFSAEPLYKRLFEGVMVLIKDGYRVNVPKFGIFGRRLIKGRAHKTPVTPSGEVRYDDRYALSFRQAQGARRALNESDSEPDPELSERGRKARAAGRANRQADLEKLKQRGKKSK